MERRSLLTGLSAVTVSALAGCYSSGPDPCQGETWTGVGYEVLLHDITYNEELGSWQGRCSLRTSFEYVYRSSTAGITGAGIAIYSKDAHRVGMIELGDMTWDQVPEERRSDMSCGGYERGEFRRDGEFTLDTFPYYIGLSYNTIQADGIEYWNQLTYTGEVPPPKSVEPSAWNDVEKRADAFPPQPDTTTTTVNARTTLRIGPSSPNCPSMDGTSHHWGQMDRIHDEYNVSLDSLDDVKDVARRNGDETMDIEYSLVEPRPERIAWANEKYSITEKYGTDDWYLLTSPRSAWDEAALVVGKSGDTVWVVHFWVGDC